MAFFSLGFSSISFGQGGPVAYNTVTRYKCISGFPGCYTGDVTLTLKSGVTAKTHIYNTGGSADQYFDDYPYFYTTITVKIAGMTSTGSFTLPANIGDQTYLDPTVSGLDDHVHHAYGVSITKTANYQYTISVSDNAY